MSDDIEGFGAGRPPTRGAESKAVRILSLIFSEIDSVAANLEEGDKHPNEDGYVDILDDGGKTFGRILVQIKKIPDKATNPPKLPKFPVPTIESSRAYDLPFIAIGVNVDSEIGYWRYINESYIESLELKPDQKTKTIHFPTDQTIERGEEGFVEQWIEVIKRKRRGPHFEELQELREKANPALQESRPKYELIHQFLDEYNRILDYEYSIVKERLYPGTWKVGFASAEYEEDRLTFSLYPIPNNTNDIQIKEVEANDFRDIINEIDNATSAHLVSGNPIQQDPIKYADDLIAKNVMKIVDNKALDQSNNEFMAKELVFYLIDEYHDLFGLGQVDKISVDEFKRGYDHMQCLIDEYISSTHEINVGKILQDGYIDLMKLRGSSAFDMETLEEKVENRMDRREDIGHRYAVGDLSFKPWQLSDAIEALEDWQKSTIVRPYIPPDYSLVDGQSWKVWQVYTPDSIERNLRAFVNNLNSEYSQMINANFPHLAEYLQLFPHTSRIVVELSIPEEGNTTTGMPSHHIKRLRSESSDEFKIDIFLDDDPEMPEIGFESREIEWDGEEYELWGTETGVADYVFRPLPLTSEIYERAERKLRDHFRERVKFTIIT